MLDIYWYVEHQEADLILAASGTYIPLKPIEDKDKQGKKTVFPIKYR